MCDDKNKINLQLKQWRSLFTTNSVAKLGVRIGYAEQRTPLNFYGRRGGSPLCLLSNDKTRRLSWMCDNENKIDLLLKQWRALFTTDIIPYASRLNWVSWQANTSDILREKGWESTLFAVEQWNSSTFMNLCWQKWVIISFKTVASLVHYWQRRKANRSYWISWAANTSELLWKKWWESTSFAFKRWNSSTFMNLWW